VIVRPATEADNLERAGRLIYDAYAALDGIPHEPGYWNLLADLRGRLRTTTVLLAVLGEDDPEAGRVVGSVTYVHDHDDEWSEHTDPGAGHFRAFAIDPAYQGRGLARPLIDACVALARVDGKHCTRIHTLDVMVAAQRLYQRYGFVRDPAGDETWDTPAGPVHGLGFVYELPPDRR
jgi:ribosomal protein S18 acetylase RimI-like enzyme